MICPNCGANISGSIRYCASCGADTGLRESEATTANLTSNMAPNQSYQNGYNQQYNQQQNIYPQYNAQYDQPVQQTQQQFSQPSYYEQHSYLEHKDPPNLPYIGMAWYRFVIYFQLFACAAMSIFYGVRFLTGHQYGEYKNLYWSYFDGLKTLDLVHAITYFVIAVSAIIIRFMLANYKKNSPKMYIGMIIVIVLSDIIYLFVILGIINKRARVHVGLFDVVDYMFVIELVIYTIMIVCNIIYFKKRSYLFTN